jgi:hypothetical protein
LPLLAFGGERRVGDLSFFVENLVESLPLLAQ